MATGIFPGKNKKRDVQTVRPSDLGTSSWTLSSETQASLQSLAHGTSSPPPEQNVAEGKGSGASSLEGGSKRERRGLSGKVRTAFAAVGALVLSSTLTFFGQVPPPPPPSPLDGGTFPLAGTFAPIQGEEPSPRIVSPTLKVTPADAAAFLRVFEAERHSDPALKRAVEDLTEEIAVCMTSDEGYSSVRAAFYKMAEILMDRMLPPNEAVDENQKLFRCQTLLWSRLSSEQRFVLAAFTERRDILETYEAEEVNELDAARQEHDDLIEAVQACRKDPRGFSPRFRNLVAFVDLAARFEDPALKLMLVNLFGNASIEYDYNKVNNQEAFRASNEGKWVQKISKTQKEGTGVCVDIVGFKEGLIVLVMGKDYFRENVRMEFLSINEEGAEIPGRLDGRHAVLVARANGQDYVLDNRPPKPRKEELLDLDVPLDMIENSLITPREAFYTTDPAQGERETYFCQITVPPQGPAQNAFQVRNGVGFSRASKYYVVFDEGKNVSRKGSQADLPSPDDLFLRTFLSVCKTEEGRRVLWQIYDLARISHPRYYAQAYGPKNGPARKGGSASSAQGGPR